jgi:hypothetical protein
MSEERDYFFESQKEFEEKFNFVPKILNHVYELNVEPRRTWANLLFFRLALMGNSLLSLCGPELSEDQRSASYPMLDHSSIAALARNLLESLVMFLYITEPTVSEEEWLLRRAVLELHDCTNRYRVLKDLGDGDSDEAKEFRSKIDPLKSTISSHPDFQSLDPDRKKKLLTGQQLYVGGIGAAARAAGLDGDLFNGMYANLSLHMHCAPASFYRSIDNPSEPMLATPSEYVYGVSAGALAYVTQPLGLACERMFQLYPEVFSKAQIKH